jgi:hypothetical protein
MELLGVYSHPILTNFRMESTPRQVRWPTLHLASIDFQPVAVLRYSSTPDPDAHH